MSDDIWTADGSATHVWKRPHSGTDVVFGVDLKLGSSTPPTIRPVDVGPNNTATTNVARNRAIRLRDKLSPTTSPRDVSPANPAGIGVTYAVGGHGIE